MPWWNRLKWTLASGLTLAAGAGWALQLGLTPSEEAHWGWQLVGAITCWPTFTGLGLSWLLLLGLQRSARSA